jgi:hypothetical protein
MSDTRPPPRAGRGCLWGCLGVAAIVLMPLIFAWGYTAWIVYTGFRENPMMRTAVEMAQRDGLAQQALGPDIAVEGVANSIFSFMPGTGTRNGYTLELSGAKGRGTLEVTSHGRGAQLKIDSMILTGPDGSRYDLLADKILSVPDGSI